MSLVKFRAENHPQQIGRRGAVGKVDDRATHPDDFAVWHAEFGFTVDVAASAHNAKCPRYFDEHQDGLTQSWAGERVWCNPPYSDIGSWVAKAWHEVTTVRPAELVVMLLPANRTEQAWWQDFVEPHRDQPDGVGGGRSGRDAHLRVRFLRGRLRFIQNGRTEIGPNERPPFGCCLLIWDSAPPGSPAPVERGPAHDPPPGLS